MPKICDVFKSYVEEELIGASDEIVRACEAAFYGGALVMLTQMPDPSKSYAHQRNRMRALITEVREFALSHGHLGG